MTTLPLRTILEQLQQGTLALDDAQAAIQAAQRTAAFEDLGFARVDHGRSARKGFPEVIFGQGKTPAQTAAIAARIVARGHTLLATRTSVEAFEAVRAVVPEAVYHDAARVIERRAGEIPAGTGTVLVASAGTSDQPVAEEAAVCAEVMHNTVDRLYDVGVAGLHRLLAEHDRLTSARVVIVVAGMEGALPSVVGGLVRVPVVAVPTSIGYGASFGGVAALLGMLNSCPRGAWGDTIHTAFGPASTALQITPVGGGGARGSGLGASAFAHRATADRQGSGLGAWGSEIGARSSELGARK